MENNLGSTIVLLARTPAALDALLRGLPAEWTAANEGEGTWSAFDVVGHLIHAERANWIPRAKTILQFGETKAFDPFDRWGHVQLVRGKTLAELLDEFAVARAQSLSELRTLNLRPEDFVKRGRHPLLGVVTLSQLLATWAVHDLNHLHQISRVMAHQYRDASGPFAKFNGVTVCTGHGA